MQDTLVNLKIKDKNYHVIKAQTPLSELNTSKKENVFILNKQRFKDIIVSVELPDCITQIGPSAFYNCTNLETVILPKNLTLINGRAFDWCDSLQEINFPKSLETIKGYAFNCCLSLSKIHIPEKVTDIEESAFFDCENIDTFTVSKDNAFYTTLDGMMTNKDKTELLIVPPKKQTETFITPKEITKLGDFLFAGYDNIKSVIISDGVTKIGDGCFANTSIKRVVLPKSLSFIGNYAFSNSKEIKSIVIHDNVKNFGSCIFDGWERTQTIFVLTKDSNNFLKLKEKLEEKSTATLAFGKTPER